MTRETGKSTPVKKPRKSASMRQQKALANLVENGGNVSKAMIDAGYSPATAKTPQKLTESDSFIALMEQEGITDQLMLHTLRDGLKAEKVVIVGNGDDAFADVQPDHQNRHKFLETAIKLKGYGKDITIPGGIHFHQHTGEKKADYEF